MGDQSFKNINNILLIILNIFADGISRVTPPWAAPPMQFWAVLWSGKIYSSGLFFALFFTVIFILFIFDPLFMFFLSGKTRSCLLRVTQKMYPTEFTKRTNYKIIWFMWSKTLADFYLGDFGARWQKQSSTVLTSPHCVQLGLALIFSNKPSPCSFNTWALPLFSFRNSLSDSGHFEHLYLALLPSKIFIGTLSPRSLCVKWLAMWLLKEDFGMARAHILHWNFPVSPEVL